MKHKEVVVVTRADEASNRNFAFVALVVGLILVGKALFGKKHGPKRIWKRMDS